MTKIGVVGVPGGWSTDGLADEVEALTGYRLVIDMAEVSVHLHQQKAYFNGVDLTELDGIIIKKIGPRYSPDLLDRLEMLRLLNEVCGVPIYSSPLHIIRLLDRLTCTMTLSNAGIPMPKTVITENVDMAVEAIQDFGKAVLKPLYTSKARGMTVIKKEDNVKKTVQRYIKEGNQIIYIQKMINDLQKDLGVSFLGGNYVATYARVGSKDSWNTTTHSGGHYQPYEPDQSIIDLAHKAQSLFHLDFTSVDVAETDEGPMVFEVSAFGGFRGLKDAFSINAAKMYAHYVYGKINNEG